MSDEIREDKDEVEAHGHTLPVSYNANDEKADEADSGDDEVEAHGHGLTNRPGYTSRPGYPS